MLLMRRIIECAKPARLHVVNVFFSFFVVVVRCCCFVCFYWWKLKSCCCTEWNEPFGFLLAGDCSSKDCLGWYMSTNSGRSSSLNIAIVNNGKILDRALFC